MEWMRRWGWKIWLSGWVLFGGVTVCLPPLSSNLGRLPILYKLDVHGKPWIFSPVRVLSDHV